MSVFEELLQQLQDLDEHEAIEAKRGTEVGKSVLETVCAFANEPKLGGGHILLGVVQDESSFLPGYRVEGVPNSDKLQADLASQLRSVFNVEVRARITAERYEEKVVLVIHVAEANPNDKPVYIERRGLPRGAYRRIGSADVECSEDDLIVFYHGRESETYDGTVLTDTSWEDVDPEAIADYRRTLEEQPNRPESLDWPDEELLIALRCGKKVAGAFHLTVAGLMLFGKSQAQRRCRPMIRVDYIRIPGREWVQDPDTRFLSTERRGPLIRVARQIWSDILDDVPKAFSLPQDSMQRAEEPLVPARVIREAVVNALMHRDYRVNSPIQILRYSNRLEFRNPGYSLKSEEHLGEPGSETRNPAIAAVLNEVRLAETKGRGISIMRERMQKAGLAPPAFDSDRGRNTFRLFLLFHHLLGDGDLAWLGRFRALELTNDERQALILARELGSMDNRVFRDISGADTLSASRSLRKLREHGLLDARGKGAGTYYVPTAHLLAGSPGYEESRVPEIAGGGIQISGRGKEISGGVSHISGGVKEISGGGVPQPEALPEMPSELASRIEGLKGHPQPQEVESVILALCAWRPHSGSELARVLGRSRRYLSDRYLSKMVAGGLLEYTIPDMPYHASQAYRTRTQEAPQPAGQD